ncbi:MAG: TolC family outer membrane protein [Burkholderiales bacterium]
MWKRGTSFRGNGLANWPIPASIPSPLRLPLADSDPKYRSVSTLPNFRRLAVHVLGGILAVLFNAACRAQSLSALLELARSSEPTYLGARSSVQAAKARTDQAFGALLPQITASANSNANDRSYHTRIDNTPTADDRYNSNSAQFTLTQPLWRYAGIAGLQQAQAAALQAEYQLAGTEQDLASKLVVAWFDVLAARDNGLFAVQQEAAAHKQWEIARRGLELGSGGLPQAEDARAKYDQARAEAMSAATEAQIKLASLEQLVGALKDFKPPRMIDDALLADLSGDKLERWLQTLETGNPAIRAALQAFEAADAEVRKQLAGHQPTLDLVGTYGKNSQAIGGFPGQAGYDIKQNSIGFQLNIPIYSGGTQSAKVAEAVAMLEKARLDIEAARRAASLAAKQAWFGWQAAFVRAQAGRQAVKAAQAALQAARKGRDTGLKMELDVLQGEQQLRAAERDLRKARYDQVAAHVKLKAVAGMVTAEDVAALDKLFVASDEEARDSAPADAVRTEQLPELRARAMQVSTQ